MPNRWKNEPIRSTHPNAGIAALGNIKSKAEINSYKSANEFLGDQNQKIVAANVNVIRKDNGIAIRLYNTDIVTYYPDETFEADNGGFNTPTTSNRCTQFGPGCYFSHANKVLHAGGYPATKGKRFRVIQKTEHNCHIEPV